MAHTHVLGLPRIGARRELKFSLESFWRGETGEAQVRAAARQIRDANLQRQAEAGLGYVSAGDFAYYDHMLGLSVLLGAAPERFGFAPRSLTLQQYGELARGNQAQHALEMTKWFDTNYHYLVPELGPGTTFAGGVEWFFDEIREAQAQGLPVKPVLVGPVSYLWLAKSHTPGFDRLSLLPSLVDAYAGILARLAADGIEWVQLDEPALAGELEAPWLDALDSAYRRLGRAGQPGKSGKSGERDQRAGLNQAGQLTRPSRLGLPAQPGAGRVKILLATYFGNVAEHAPRLAALPVDGFHIDLVRAPEQLPAWLDVLPREAVLSAGVIDGRNIWRSDLRRLLGTLRPLHARLGERLWLAPSCSLLHVPVTLAGETRLDAELYTWLAFAAEKLIELRTLARGLNEGDAAIAAELAASDAAHAARRQSPRVIDAAVRQRAAALTPAMAERRSPFAQRIARQKAALDLPPFPTTTIGSFPQTPAIRQARAELKRGALGAADYRQRMHAEIRLAVERQEALGLDVLVHGEAERNDMVEYFGEQLRGYAFSDHGWVQSYGSRCVKPPLIYGDVSRPAPMTVEITTYAQTLTAKPMKGMLTGPVTMLQWSFVRDDQPREATALQLALAIRDEVADLEAAGIRVIQIDEPAFREGLPLKRRDWDRYLAWAVRAFKVSAAAVRDDTQIHTHMCYSEFNDILASIAALDADVITIETSRSNMELLDGFGAFAYPNEIGPGVYDIHSPRIPSVEEMVGLLQRASRVIAPRQLWINPDCGLKTRGWPETEAALGNLVEAARRMRAALA